MLLTTDIRDFRDINHERSKNPFDLCNLCSDKKLCGFAFYTQRFGSSLKG